MSGTHMFEMIFCMSFMLSESRSWMSPSPKDGRKMSKEIRDGFFMFSLGRLTASAQPEQIVIDMILSFAVESFVDVVAHLRHVVAKAVAVEALSEASLLRLDKQGASTVNVRAAVMIGCLIAFAFSPCGSGGCSGSAAA